MKRKILARLSFKGELLRMTRMILLFLNMEVLAWEYTIR